MSKIWDALRKAEERREEPVAGTPTILPYRVQLTPKQRSAIEALLSSSSLEEVERACGVKEVTLRRWLAQPSFVAAYYAAGADQLRDSLHRLRASTGDAVEVLRKALDDENASVRIQAAAAILNAATLRDPAEAVPAADAATTTVNRKNSS